MTLLQRTVSALTRGASAPPVAVGQSGGQLSLAGGNASSPQGRVAQMEALGSAGWLFAVVERIDSAVMESRWKLYRKLRNGEREEVDDHPALDLINKVNPFYTREMFLEASAQHDNLTGEMWWLLIGERDDEIGPNNPPVEMWLIRPDRIAPVPDARKFILGYVYKAGGEPIPLRTDQVIYTRRPSPLDPYRGMGPVQSILADLGAEALSAQWRRAFYRNSAEPGGIIEVDREMSNREWDDFQARWRAQHQGVSNAHRVAVLERARWVDRKYTQADMQYVEDRRLSRDLILGAFGVHGHMLGIADSINRANAEAAEVTFSRWTVRPRLVRIRGSLNEFLLPLFGEADLEFDFVDQTPADRALDLAVAKSGYQGQILTKNEARDLLGYDEVEGGDEFYVAPAPSPFGGFGKEPVVESIRKSAPALTRGEPSTLASTETAMRAAWGARLASEAASLAVYLDQFKGAPDALTRLEASDLSGYSWDWWSRYGKEVTEELTRAFSIALLDVYPDMGQTEAGRYAAQWAEHHAGQLLQMNGERSMVALTRRRVAQLVAETLEEGQGLQYLQKHLREDFAFSPDRARAVARTETATAQGQGAKQAAVAQGMEIKRWITQGDDVVESECLSNEEAGWIAVGDPFPSGHETIPIHPNCRCNVRYRHRPVAEPPTDAAPPAEVRCPWRGHLVAKGHAKGTPEYCRNCKKEFTA